MFAEFEADRSHDRRVINLLEVWLGMLISNQASTSKSDWIALLAEFSAEYKLLKQQKPSNPSLAAHEYFQELFYQFRYSEAWQPPTKMPDRPETPDRFESTVRAFAAELTKAQQDALPGVIAHHLGVLFSLKATMLGYSRLGGASSFGYAIERPDWSSGKLVIEETHRPRDPDRYTTWNWDTEVTGDQAATERSKWSSGKVVFEETRRPRDPDTHSNPAPIEHVEAPREMELELSGPEPSAEEPSYLRSRKYRVWFGTDRELVGKEGQLVTFGEEFGNKLRLGNCVVHVPRSHEFGQLRSSWIKRTYRRLLGKEDDALKLLSCTPTGAKSFQRGIARDLQHWRRRTALVFVHGYNVPFQDAVLRAAQIGFDLRVEGITAVFSWPSKGTTALYTHDGSSIELAERHFLEFLSTLARVQGLEEINIMAHSMGNRLLCRTIEKIVKSQSDGTMPVAIGHIVLAAADMTAAFFEQYAHLYAQLARKRVTNYTHRGDRALTLSVAVNGTERVGLEPPVFVHPALDTVSVSALDLDLLGHGYVASAAPLLYDVADLLHNDRAPHERVRCQRHESGAYWTLTR
jgi:esterase/lipase superfamily enzyme